MPNPLRVACVLLVTTLAVARGAAARPFEVATFALDAPADVTGPRVAVGSDGAMVFAWQSGDTIRTQHYSQAGVALSAPLTIATGVALPVITGAPGLEMAADTRGAYVVAYSREGGGYRHLFGRRLDATGAPIGAELAVDAGTDADVLRPTVLGLPSGFAFVWQQDTNCWLRRYDPNGVALADPFPIGDNGYYFPLAAAALDDGGIAVVWHDPSVHTFLGRSFNPDGTSRVDPKFLEGIPLDIQAIAATATGGFVAVEDYGFSTLRAVEFDASLDVVRVRDLETLPATDRPLPWLARDGVGRWLVVFATARYDDTHTFLESHLAPRALPLAADLTPLEPSFALAAGGAPAVVTALLPSGSFVSTWATDDARGYANVASLCTPDVHVCGDGVLDPRCEECDAGAANSDTTPNACRTSCELPHCGDGVADAGEACDDGTPSPCDGCDASCQVVAGLACGDGILVPGCADQCDDGNLVAGDGCGPACTLERIPGGGSASSDCESEWIVANPTNVPLLDGHGKMRRTQRCVDDDPACDFDGGTPGACTFHVRVCAGNTDVAGCSPSGLARWELAKPSSTQAAHRPALAAVRAAFAGVPAALTGTSSPDLCTDVLDVVVPLRGSAPHYGTGSLVLGATATGASGIRDKDTLKLLCVP